MKFTEFKLIRLDDFAAAIEKETSAMPGGRTPFGLGNEGYFISGWEMSFKRLGFFTFSWGKHSDPDDDTVMIDVPPTASGIAPLSKELPYGWTGKINEFIAEAAAARAFELTTIRERYSFLSREKPSVIFSYIDSNGPGEITAKFNGLYWTIAD